ncbi:MAG TPA: hypothetical protein VFA57_13005 [Pseudolabrys sp.]|jgi:hypothetical protein|nr:hypothetical protein [Pseudolabrys sp.]
MQTASERLKCDLRAAIGDMRIDLERVEILTAALYAFSMPVPDYEPRFHNTVAHLNSHELGCPGAHES